MNANTIPDITDPLGFYWEQPYLGDVLIDDTHAVMTEGVFRGLIEYSSTAPSGVYEGKAWKRFEKYKTGSRWFLCWYGEGLVPGRIYINFREILVA